MSRHLRFLAAFLAVIVIYSCQKETSFEQGQLSRGSLQSQAGDCLPKQVKGTYKAGVALGDTNYLEVTVDVAQTGPYSVTTDTINGYSFRGTGTFANTGAQVVQLRGYGTPGTAGTNNFTVRYDSTACAVAVTVVANTGGSSGSAAFTLNGSPNACMNAAVQGTYTQLTPVTAANKVNIQVNVTTPGTWSLTTNTVTGLTFSGSGTFTTTGAQTISLNAAGIPTTAGSQTFSVTTGTASCTFALTVVPGTVTPAAFTLQGAPGSCMTASAQGTYTQGTPLTSANTLTVSVNVTTIGPWAVTTNPVAGITFAGAGNFTNTGVQNIVLVGTGTPTASGAQTFTVTAGTSTCTYALTVGGTTPTNTDHFPLTPNSYWTYLDPFGTAASDTIKVVNLASVTGAGNTYRKFTTFDNAGDTASHSYYRRSGNDYLEFNRGDNYALATFASPLPTGEILFLKEGATTGQTWSSAEFTGTEDGTGTALKVKYNFTVINANTTLTIGSRTYTNVYKVNMQPQSALGTAAYSNEALLWEYWYAAGVGLIQFKVTAGTQSFTQSIRYYQVF